MSSQHPDSPKPILFRGATEAVVLSVVLPMHDEEGNIPALFARLQPVLDRVGLPYEVVCVDDGSRDGTWDMLLAVRARNPRVKLLRFSRNFGKEVAMSAGLRHAGGRAVVLMDSDLQHPPELIETFVARWQSGAQMVYGVREGRETDGWLRRTLTRAFYGTLDRLSEVDLPRDAGDFRLMDRVVVDALNAMPERTRFMKGLYSWVGFRQEAVPFQVADRHAGSSKFGLWRLMRFALDGFASFSTVPLRMWSWLGLAVAALSGLYGLWIVGKTLVYGIEVPGYASLMVTTLFLGGVQLICLGVLGDYVGRIFTEVKGRPLYLVGESHGLAQGREEARGEPAAELRGGMSP